MLYNLKEGKCVGGDFANAGAVFENCQFVPLDGSLFTSDTKPGFSIISSGGYDYTVG